MDSAKTKTRSILVPAIPSAVTLFFFHLLPVLSRRTMKPSQTANHEKQHHTLTA